MLVRTLYAVIVALALVAGVEIGFLQWGTEKTQDAGDGVRGTGDAEWTAAAPVPSPPRPAGLGIMPAPAPVVAEAPRAQPVRPRKKPPAQASAADLAECARSGGPLCGIPR